MAVSRKCLVRVRLTPHRFYYLSRGAKEGLLALLARGACVHLDQLEVVLLGGLRDASPRSPPSAEGCHKRAVLAAQCDYVRVRLVYVIVELGEHLLFHAFSFTYLLRAFSHPFWATESSLRRCIIGGACCLAVTWEL